MKNEIFIYYAKCLFEVYGIPVRIYKGNALAVKEESVPLSSSLEGIFDNHLLPHMSADNKKYALYQSYNVLSYGYIRNKTGNLSLIIGPSRSSAVNRQTLLGPTTPIDYTQRNEKLITSLEMHLNAIPIMQIGRFCTIVSSIYAAVYGEAIPPEQMEIIRPKQSFNVLAHKKVAQHFENVAYGDIQKSNYYDFEKRLLLLVRNGMTEQVAKIWQDASPDIQISGDNSVSALRIVKDHCILAIGIVSNTVLDTGVNQSDIYKLRDTYILQTENCLSVQEVTNLRFNMLIDFCKQVESMDQPSTNIPIVNYAVKYINDNIEQKLSLEDIARHVHTGKTYLCAEFGKAMGTGIARYIQKQKVRRAKELLLLTDKPLSVISELLSFSSQSYFQNIFKDVTGITPREFRNQAKL